MNIDKYLDRIGLKTAPKTDLSGLQLLQSNHLYNVPFENLDIHIGRTIILDYQRIYEKIVQQKRGGFCHELNGLFYLVLCELGFDAKRISARVINDQNLPGHEYGHMTILVTIDGEEWLTDVGFGRFSFWFA